MKLAILLLCHKNPEQINDFILSMLHPDIDIFIHIDKKSDIIKDIITRKNVYILDHTSRIDVRWGEFSQVEAMLSLLKFSSNKFQYDYYWFCSGQDFPIKPISDILKYFFTFNGDNFIQFIESEHYGKKIENNFDKRNKLYFPKRLLKNKFIWRCLKRLYIELTGGYNHTYKLFERRDIIGKIPAYFGSQWSCLHKDFVVWLQEYLDSTPMFIQGYKHVMCPDESFFQTLLMLSPDCNNIRDFLHYIDWSEGKSSPKTLKIEDFDLISISPYFMARKFDYALDRDIITLLNNKLKNNH